VVLLLLFGTSVPSDLFKRSVNSSMTCFFMGICASLLSLVHGTEEEELLETLR
ncbi:hypothetical protein HAX54_030112, partial [Datura stramonium]|nr:hypothetical protein [Datura stramonium]